AAAIASGELAMMQSAERWYRGELLPAARYNDWAAVPRERLQRRYARLLVAVAEAAEDAGDVDLAIEKLRIAIDLYAQDETYYVMAARILLRAGRPGAARRFVEQAERVAADVGVAPYAEVQQLRDEIARTS